MTQAVQRPEIWQPVIRRGYADEAYVRAVFSIWDLAEKSGRDPRVALGVFLEGAPERRRRLAREKKEERERGARNLLAGLLRSRVKLEKSIADAEKVVRGYDYRAGRELSDGDDELGVAIVASEAIVAMPRRGA